MAIRYAIYTRQSVAKSGDPFSSCSAQFSICREFIQSRSAASWELIDERFDDEGASGTAVRRPALDRLLARIADGQVQAVVVYKLDRLARTLRHIVAIADQIQQHGAELMVVAAPLPVTDAMGSLQFNLMATVADFEWSMIRSRILDSLQMRKQLHRRLAGAIPYGYAVDGRTRQLVPDPLESGRVAAIFAYAKAGELPASIAATINARGWRTKEHLSRSTGQTRGGGAWTPRQILGLLRNPTVTGRFRDGREGTRAGNHQAIVDQDTFDQVQVRIGGRRTQQRPRTSRTPDVHPLSGRLLCPRCGRFLSPHQRQVVTGPQTSFIQHHYRCRSHAGGHPPCRGVSLPAHDVEVAVIGMLADLAQQADLSPAMRAIAALFQAAWASLDAAQQRRWIPQLVECVSFGLPLRALRVRISESGCRALINHCQ